MNLFKKYYKAANDDIKPNRQLIDKIFDEADRQTQTVSDKKPLRFRVGYGTAIAAVLIVVLSVFVYPQLDKSPEQPQVAKNDRHTEQNTEITSAKDLKQQEELTKNEHQNKAKQEYVAEIKEKVAASDSSEDSYSTPKIAKTQSEDGTSSAHTEKIGDDIRLMTALQLPEQEKYSVLISNIKAADENEATEIETKLKKRFGESDATTGNTYIFEIVGTFKAYDKEYCLGRWRWLTDGHSSLICEFVLSMDFSEMYECSYTEDEKIEWNCSENLID